MSSEKRAVNSYAIYEKARKKHGFSNYEVAKLTGITASTLCDWKHGRYTPKLDKLKKISELLCVPLENFC